MGRNWQSSDYRAGWFAGKRHEKKLRPLWILLGVVLRELIRPFAWSLLQP